jgi:hypothetical protein
VTISSRDVVASATSEFLVKRAGRSRRGFEGQNEEEGFGTEAPPGPLLRDRRDADRGLGGNLAPGDADVRPLC